MLVMMLDACKYTAQKNQHVKTKYDDRLYIMQ